MATRLETGEELEPKRHVELPDTSSRTWTFCPGCKAEVVWDRTCPKCGTTIPLFDFAGARNIDAAASEPPEAAQAKQSTSERLVEYGSLLWGIIVISGALAGILLVPGWID